MYQTCGFVVGLVFRTASLLGMPDTRRTAHESPREPNVGQQSLLQPIIPSLRYSCDLAQQASLTSFFLRFLIIVRTHLLFLFSWLSRAGGSFWGGNGEMNAWGRISGGGCSREWTMVAKPVRVVSRLWSEQLRMARGGVGKEAEGDIRTTGQSVKVSAGL